MFCVCTVTTMTAGVYSEVQRRREVLERVRGEEGRMKIVLEARERETELRKRESQLVGTEPES